MSEERESPPSSRGIGTIARRLGRWVADVSDAVSFPESLRSALSQAFGDQARGEQDQAVRALLNVSVQRNAAALATSAELLLSLADLDPMPMRSDPSPTARESLVELIEKGEAGELLKVPACLADADVDSALDILRRERTRAIALPPEVSSVRPFVLAMWTARADAAYGRYARTLLGLARVQPHLRALVSHLRAPLCVQACDLAILSALHEGDQGVLDSWGEILTQVMQTQGGELEGRRLEAWKDAHARAVELGLRIQISRGDPELKATLHAIPLGEMHVRAEIAGLHHSAHDELPDETLRFTGAWRLALTRRIRRWVQTPSKARYKAFVADFNARLGEIEQELSQAPMGARSDLVAELAFFALAAQHNDVDWGHWVALLERSQQRLPATLRMAQALAQLARGDAQAQALQATITIAESESYAGAGFDESSPLRWPSLRDPVFYGILAELSGQCAQLAGQPSQAEHHFARALSCWPYLKASQARLDAIGRDAPEVTLSAELDRLAEQFAPQHTDPTEIQAILRGCQHSLVSERERLSRPFTLAVMGEFSAGKSTFVNALIGREVAPMGVLPTTNTVNRFRHGKGTIRVHYENGRIEYIDADQDHKLLEDIDEDKAKQIQYLDIEGDFEQLADLVIVDTPGLNATQAHHEQITRSFVDQADAVLWIFSATRAGASTESEIIKSLQAESRPILGLLNKTDTITPDEQQELLEYLHQQFGSRLLDIVPICAFAALASRDASSSEQDRGSLRQIQSSLREHLLDKTPEHKRSVALGQSIQALSRAAAQVRTRIEAAERPQPAGDEPALGQDDVKSDLLAVQDTWLSLDAYLVRIALDLGIAASGRGRLLEDPGPDERRYLHHRAQQRFFANLDALLSPGQEDRTGMRWHPWAPALRDWLDGYWAGLHAQDTLSELVLAHAPLAKQGERAFREALRAGLLECSGAFADLGHPLARRMRSWMRAGQTQQAQDRGDGAAYLQRVLLPKILGAQKRLAQRDPTGQS